MSDPLVLYLDDHLAGAAAGLRLAERLARDDHRLDEVRRQISEDRATLYAMLRRFGAGPSVVKPIGARIVELASRVRLGRRSGPTGPVNLLLQLEALSMGIEGKRHLWRSLLEIVSIEPRLDAAELSELAGRADHQLLLVEALRLSVAVAALDHHSVD